MNTQENVKRFEEFLNQIDQEASTLLEDEKDKRAWIRDEGKTQASQSNGCDFQKAEVIGGTED